MTRTIATQMISLDGFTAGPDQSLEHPLGVGAEEAFTTWMFHSDHPLDKATVAELHTPSDACLMGRNMFGPVRGSWDSWEHEWRGWWGEDPPYHSPVVVLTHHERESLEVQGGNTFIFETGGFDAGYARAVELAGPGGTVRVTGGCSVVRQAIEAGVLDELQLVQVPVLLGDGERLLEGLPGLRLEPIESAASPYAVHTRYRVVPGSAS